MALGWGDGCRERVRPDWSMNGGNLSQENTLLQDKGQVDHIFVTVFVVLLQIISF